MNITLKLNNEIIKYGVCHIYSNSGLSTPVILSNGNGSGGNTITASVNGIVALTASNCPSSIYCRIESSPSANNSANFRLKTNQVTGISPSATAKTLDMGFISNIFVATDVKCTIGYDLLTLGYRYSFSKITPANYTIPTGTSTDMVLYNKAFTYKTINSLDKTSYGSTTTQTTFGTYSSINATNMLNTTRGVNLSSSNYTIQVNGLHRSGSPLQSQTIYGDNYTISGVSVNIAGFIVNSGNVIANYTITPSVEANKGYILTSHSGNYTGITSLRNKGENVGYAYNSGWIPLTCFNIPITSQLAGKIINTNSTAVLLSPYNLILTYSYSNNGNLSTKIAVSFCLCEIDESADWDNGYYKPLSFCNNYYTVNASGDYTEDDIYIPIQFELGKGYTGSSSNYTTPNSFYFKQNTTYALFVRVVVGNPGDFVYVRLGADTNGSLNTSIKIEIPEKVVTFENVSKAPLVPVYLTLTATSVNECKSSYLKISYSDYSYTTGKSSSNLDNTITSCMHWLNANPAKIGVSGSVSYTNLYKNINISGGDNTTGTRTKKTTTYIAKAIPAVCYNDFTTTQWYTTQSSTKSYQTNAVFDITAITSTNIKYSINEVLSGKHKLTQIRVEVS